MKINILTLFPEMFSAITGSILGRASDKGLLEFNFINIRDFSQDKHKHVDDYPFGGGPGMVMQAEPIFAALRSLGLENNTGNADDKSNTGNAGKMTTENTKKSESHKNRILYMSPRGKVLSQEMIRQLAEEEEFTILCGHYEGVDQRVIDYWNMEEVSIGDYILTGGELPAMVLTDAVARLVPGVLASEDSANEESIYSGLLEYPQYTKPREFEGMTVPEVLVSGNHKLIHLWKFEESLRLTQKVRRDLFDDFVKNAADLTKDEQKVLEKITK